MQALCTMLTAVCALSPPTNPHAAKEASTVVPLCSQERGEVVDGSLRRTLSGGLHHPSSWLAPFLTPASPA
ncbi:hypothetical protein KUCAC02_030866 [Chaenocephalus aceratus]|uniref:Uncharacterized protein n=1 Tax=Chaenocephalus aceratus TaxID=36190 RepID=A0ACB9XM58_CHAAC|nr:hypothetical protein KUCAC02_030866 [Chaenocephalus aceratus]